MNDITHLTADILRTMPLPHRSEGDKQSRGTVLVIAGSAEVPGAALLAGVGALRSGAGRLRIATPARNATTLGIAVPEALVLGLDETADGGIDASELDKVIDLVNRADAVLVGPGLTD